MKTLYFCVALTFIVCGCQGNYVHPTKSAQDFERDKNECEKIAKYMAVEAGSSNNPFYIETEMNKCLGSKFGWSSN